MNRIKKYGKVKAIFRANPQGLTIEEACFLYKKQYPEEIRDIAAYICGQKSFGNFKIIGMRDDQSIYVLHTPTQEEKIIRKIEACEKCITQGQATKEKMLTKLAKLRAKRAKVSTQENYDFDYSNYST